ncbi:hypothetical protein DSAG12_00327 [Promethearchaeum syntrophicum]|uniref:Uncharacterized protein n=1 Tax=Promethearchaeum syntrophicum TaxID=2594042 RepID=A0A5B9D5Z7_9ARCH|nr:hypothetical protein [Candidatus Prometheoarchaeum syntrophicum]QEE14514.1 hypothetical protein DSAG12_00327 [Candidatus Prometheoarchaeum syntrophicum]
MSEKQQITPKSKSILKTLLPDNVNNDVKFNKIIVYIFGVLTIFTIVRSLIHIFAPDGGANSIATIVVFSGSPDPNNVIYHIFSLWGLSQLLIGLIYIIVLMKYKNLIPMMFTLMIIEYVMRFVTGIMKPMGDVLTGTPPGALVNLILVPLALGMLIWSFFPVKRKTS